MINLKPTHKAVKDSCADLEQIARLGVKHESAVRSAFQALGTGVGNRPVPGEGGQAQQDCEPSEPGRWSAEYIAADRAGDWCGAGDGGD